MTLRTIGALPGSQLHPGLDLALGPLEIKLGELNGRIAAAEARALAVLNVDAGFLETAVASFTTMLDVDFAATAEIDALDAKLAAIAALEDDIGFLAGASSRLSVTLGKFTAALGVGQIHTWSYDGASSVFGPKLTVATRGGFGDIAPETDIRAAIFASSSAANWTTFSGAVYTGWGGGSVATRDDKGLPIGTLTSLGAIPGGTLLASAALASPAVSTEITALAAVSAGISINLALLLIANFGVGVALGAAAAIAASASLLLPIPSVEIDLQLVLDLAARVFLEPIVLNLQAAINGSGIHIWSYEGPAGQLGAEFATKTSKGIAGGGPRDRSMGLVIATDNVEAFDDINQVLKVR